MRVDTFHSNQSAKNHTSETSHLFENLGNKGTTKNDSEIKVEKALIQLNEIQNDLMISKGDVAKPKPP